MRVGNLGWDYGEGSGVSGFQGSGYGFSDDRYRVRVTGGVMGCLLYHLHRHRG